MGEVVLIHPQSYNPSKSALIWPPLGLCRIASYLEKRGHEVKIIEDALNKYEISEIEEQIGDCKLVGIGAMTLQTPRARVIASSIRTVHPKKFIVVQKPYMERRSYATFKKVWPEKEIIVTSLKSIGTSEKPESFTLPVVK